MGFSEYLRLKKAKGNSLIKVKQFEMAVKDKDKAMLIWLGKQRLGQKDKVENEVHDHRDKKIEVEIVRPEKGGLKIETSHDES